MIFKSEIIFVKIVIPIAVGITTGYFFQNQLLFQISLIALTVSVLVGLFINLTYKSIKAWRHKKIISGFYYLIFFWLGLFITLNHTDLLKKDYFAHKSYQQLKVWITSEPEISNDIARFEVKVTEGYHNKLSRTCTGNLLIALKLDSLSPIKLKYGDELLITANYLPVEAPYNPYEFDFKAWLATKNIYHQTFIRQNQLVKLAENKGNPIIDYALKLRQQQVATYRKLIVNDEAFAVASTLILGYRADLSKETLAAYSKTGTIHALSVSGMHVGIIYIMLNWLLSFLDRKRAGQIFKVILICSLIWGYSLLTGFSPSVLRSAIMLSVYILAKQLKRSTNNYNVISFTAIILLIIDPFVIWNVGFQLSFLAVLGLIYYQPKIYKWCFFKYKWADKLWSAVAMSLAAQLATLPLSIYYFHQFPVYFIISNLFILLPITALMYGGLAILVLNVYCIAPWFERLIIFVNDGLKWISSLPYAGITEIWINQWQLLLICLFLLYATFGMVYYKKKHIIASLVILLSMQVYLGYQKHSASQQEEIILFSLRKNYAAAFIVGNECVLLTDLNENDRNFEFFVKPALDQKRIENIQFVDWSKEMTSGLLIKKHNQILFKEKTFLLIDSSFNSKRITSVKPFDFVWLHSNPKQKLDILAHEISFSNLIIDASNKDYLINRFKKQADSLKIDTHVLKKQPAVIIKLN